MNILSFATIIATFFVGSLLQAQTDIVSFLSNPSRPLGSLTTFGVAVEPIKNNGFIAPILGARSVEIMDYASGKTLFSKNPKERLPMASLTKIMTALVVLDKQPNLDKVVSVPSSALTVEGSLMNLQVNETMTIRNLLKGLLIESGNDSAMTLAINTSGSVNEFVKLMNQKATDLGLADSHFVNPHGFDANNHYTTAHDLVRLTRVALNNPIFSQIVKTRKETVTDTTGQIKHNLDNTNKLLDSYLNVIGVKTGTTSEAGESLVSSAVGNDGQIVIVALLHSPDRFQEAKSALDWALRAYSWLTPIK